MSIIRAKELKHIFFYSLILAILVFILKWIHWKFLIVEHSIDIYIGLVALFFTALGIWISSQWRADKIEQVDSEEKVFSPLKDDLIVNQQELNKLNLTKREREILHLIVKGHSNMEIASHLFLSVSTVKTHVSNLYSKMDVKRRSQAIAKARKLKIVL